MPWIDVEQKIRDAIARGEFDNLPGAGKPQDHSGYFALPEELRMGYTVLKNAGYIPDEVDLLKKIGALREQLAGCTDLKERQSLNRTMMDLQLRFDILMDQRRRFRRTLRSADI
jgi:hypothetical protein